MAKDTHLLQMSVHVLGQLAEEHAEQGGEQRTGEVESLGAKVISVVEFATLERGQEQAVHHVAEEERLFRVLPGRHRDVRQHLLLQDLLRVVDTAVARECGDRTSSSDEIECDLSGGEAEPERGERGGFGECSAPAAS